MTILLTTKRNSLAVLSAERLESRPDRPPMILGPKLICHTTLPLAFGVTGSSWWVRSRPEDGGPTLDFLEELAAQMTSPEELVLPDIARRVRTMLQPGYDVMRSDIAVAIALFKDGRAEAGIQWIGRNTHLVEDRSRPLFPRSLDSFYGQDRFDALHDERINDETEVVRLARQFVLDGIVYEASSVEWNNRQCGGPVDVVLVNEHGARFVD